MKPIVLLGLLWAIWSCSDRSEHLKSLYQQYYTPDTFRLESMRDELSVNSGGQLAQLREGLDLLSQKQNQAAFDKIWAFLYQNPGDRRVDFLAAQSLMALERQGEASAILEPLADAPDFVWRDDAQWYLALCFLQKQADEPRAQKRLLSTAADPNSPYRQQAAALLQELYPEKK